jgi:hypothetical protein
MKIVQFSTFPTIVGVVTGFSTGHHASIKHIVPEHAPVETPFKVKLPGRQVADLHDSVLLSAPGHTPRV